MAGEPSKFSIIVSSVKAGLARLILGIHALVVVWRTSLLGGNIYWLFLLVLVGSFVDLTWVIVKRKGVEWKWFSPCIFFYLATTIPCIWLLEMDVLRLKRLGVENITVSLETGGNVPADLAQFANVLNSSFSGSEWVTVLEQAMLLFLIISRWIMPVSKDQMSRDQLSQLLLVYLGIGADILELFTIFEEPQILKEDMFVQITLGIWSWSLLQFTMVLTATRGRAFSNKVEDADGSNVESDDDKCCDCFNGEIWAIVVMSLMLDLPFLALRLTAIVVYKVQTLTIYFFTSKNILVLILQMYRLLVIVADSYSDWKGRKNKGEHGEPVLVNVQTTKQVANGGSENGSDKSKDQ